MTNINSHTKYSNFQETLSEVGNESFRFSDIFGSETQSLHDHQEKVMEKEELLRAESVTAEIQTNLNAEIESANLEVTL